MITTMKERIHFILPIIRTGKLGGTDAESSGFKPMTTKFLSMVMRLTK